jgi:hypothetical protein
MTEQNFCEYYTKRNLPCPFRAKSYSRESDKFVCRFHEKSCKSLYNSYKKECNVIWNKKCLSSYTNNQINKIIDIARECKRQRIDFYDTCCSKVDRRHIGAIAKVDTILDTCYDELDKRRY